ncbi:mRNA decapping complex subunit 2 [Schistosoma japonicum]|nr:mRNA decapping complex subunit 2 [Schistosoma japonicum]
MRRFLLNIPKELKEDCEKNFVRTFFEVERAHWFYVDYCIEDPSFHTILIGDLLVFAKFPSIVPKGTNWQEKFVEWKKYRGSTATGSMIIIDEHYKMILLVQGFYGNRWSLPGGKINQNESLVDCAAREVMEETGLDLANRISPSIYIDRHVGGTLRRAFIIEGLPRTSRLKPGTKNEIEAITWFRIANLPIHTHDIAPIETLNSKPSNFYLVIPFMRQLKLYIEQRLSGKHAGLALSESERLCRYSLNCSIHQHPAVNNLSYARVNATITPSKKPKRNKKSIGSKSPNQSLSEDGKVGEKSRIWANLNVPTNAESGRCGHHNTKFFFLSLMDSKTYDENIQNSCNNNIGVGSVIQMVSCWHSLQIDRNKLLEYLCNSTK